MKIKIKILKKNTLFENYLYILRNVSSIKEKKKKKKEEEEGGGKGIQLNLLYKMTKIIKKKKKV
jgi:hypothetical protein